MVVQRRCCLVLSCWSNSKVQPKTNVYLRFANQTVIGCTSTVLLLWNWGFSRSNLKWWKEWIAMENIIVQWEWKALWVTKLCMCFWCLLVRNMIMTAAQCARSSSERLCCRSSSHICCRNSQHPAHLWVVLKHNLTVFVPARCLSLQYCYFPHPSKSKVHPKFKKNILSLRCTDSYTSV